MIIPVGELHITTDKMRVTKIDLHRSSVLTLALIGSITSRRPCSLTCIFLYFPLHHSFLVLLYREGVVVKVLKDLSSSVETAGIDVGLTQKEAS